MWVLGKAAGTIAFWWTYLQYYQTLENYMNTVRTAHTGEIKAYATGLEVVTMSERLPESTPLWMLFQYALFKLPPALYLQDGYLRIRKVGNASTAPAPNWRAAGGPSGHACIVQQQ